MSMSFNYKVRKSLFRDLEPLKWRKKVYNMIKAKILGTQPSSHIAREMVWKI